MYLAQSQHGKLAWKDLFGDAERLADGGFPVPHRMADAASSRAPQASQPDAVAYFTKPDGTKVKFGDTMKNPAYADTCARSPPRGPRRSWRARSPPISWPGCIRDRTPRPSR